MTDYYIAADAAGGGDGLSTSDPLTLAEMVGTSGGKVKTDAPGNTFHVKAGTYDVNSTYLPTPNPGNKVGAEVVGYKTTPGDLDAKIATGSPQVFGTDLPLFEVSSDSRYIGIDGSFWSFRNLSFTSSANRPAYYARAYYSSYRNCHFVNTGSGGTRAWATEADNSRNVFVGCSFRSTNSANTQTCVKINTHHNFFGCYFEHANTSAEIMTFGGYGTVANCIFVGGGVGLYASGNSSLQLYANNTFYNQATSGLQLRDNTGITVTNNLFHTCSTGIDVLGQSSSYDGMIACIENNAYFNVTTPNSAYLNTLIVERDSITESSDPLTDAAGGDFSLVAGANSVGAAFPAQVPFLANGNHADVGALQKEAGAGGSFRRITLSGGFAG